MAEPDLLKTSVGGIVRHLVTTAGGALATSGVIAADDVTVLVGAVMALFGIAWSILQKWLAARNPGSTTLSAALPSTILAVVLALAVAGCSAVPKPRDAKDALAIAEYTVQGLTDTALAATQAGLIRGSAASEALDKLSALRGGLAIARAAVANGDPDADLKVRALDGLVLALSTFLEARGVSGPGSPPPQSESPSQPRPQASGLVVSLFSGRELRHVR